MNQRWPSLLRTARRLLNLTQEDFAADLGRGQSTVALWESGRRPVPPAVRRRVLDIMGGYYRMRPEYGTLLARAMAAPNPTTMYRQGMFVQAANPVIRSMWRQNGFDLEGLCILPLYRRELRVTEVLESYVFPMLNGTSNVVSLSFSDRSVIIPDQLVERTLTVYRVGEGRIMTCSDQLVGIDHHGGMPEANLRLVTLDDVAG